MGIPWPLTFFSSTRPPPSVRSHFLTHHHLPTNSATSLSTSQPSLLNKSHPFITTPTKPHNRRLKITVAHFNFSFDSFPPLISSHESRSLGNMDLALHSWCIRPLIGRSEKTKVRSVLSGALVSTLMALAMTNLNIIVSEVPVYSVVLEYLLPVAFHLLLFRADLHCILQSIRVLLLVFLLGSSYSY